MQPTESKLWRWIKWFQYSSYLMATIIMLQALAYADPSSWIWLRFGDWHHLIIMQYLVVAIVCRRIQPATFMGMVRSFTVPLLAGVVGEAYYTYFYFIPYYQPWNDPIVASYWWYGTAIFAAIAFLCYTTQAYKYVKWETVGLGLLFLSPLMIAWILALDFHVSLCICYYRLQYFTDPLINTIEVLYYTIYFSFFAWSLKQ